jgi:type VI secretion system protein ImpH
MQTTSRKIRISVIERLFKKPFQFGFFQAVRLLKVVNKSSGGNEVKKDRSLVRFKSRLSLETPSAEIHDLTGDLVSSKNSTAQRPVNMIVNFLGLTGSSGALPTSYTELLIERQIKYRDEALRHFLDIFNHRFIELFYQSWAKHRLYIDWETERRDGVVRNILDLMGFGAQSLRSKLDVDNIGVSDLNLAFYSGVMAGKTRTADGLALIIQDHYGVKAEVQQFRGRWVKIPEDQCTSLGKHENVLGEGSILGVMYWDQQSAFRVRLGPLNHNTFRSMLPYQKSFESLSRFINFYAGPTLDFDIQVILNRQEVPACVLGGESEDRCHLGWSTWLSPTKEGPDLDHSVFRMSDAPAKNTH